MTVPDSATGRTPPTIAGPGDLCTAGKVRRLSRRISQIYDEALSRHGLTIGQFGLLSCLSRRHGLAISALAGRLGADSSTVSRLVRPLAAAGLLRIDADPEDRRGRLVRLTDKGHGVRGAAYHAWLAAQTEVAERLGAGRLAALRFLLDEAHDRLEAGL
jgi:DNA-binding MarR family transcriptional regulator